MCNFVSCKRKHHDIARAYAPCHIMDAELTNLNHKSKKLWDW